MSSSAQVGNRGAISPGNGAIRFPAGAHNTAQQITSAAMIRGP